MWPSGSAATTSSCPPDAIDPLRHVRPADQQWFIEEVTQALAAAAETKDFRPLQDVLEAWTATVRLQRQPGEQRPGGWTALVSI